MQIIEEISCPEPSEEQFYVYLLQCADRSFYCGSTRNLKNRLKEHNLGEAAAWSRMRRPIRLVFFETHDSLLSARRREKQIKGWTIAKKMNLIKGFLKKL